jgi:hypothetical protein
MLGALIIGSELAGKTILKRMQNGELIIEVSVFIMLKGDE